MPRSSGSQSVGASVAAILTRVMVLLLEATSFRVPREGQEEQPHLRKQYRAQLDKLHAAERDARLGFLRWLRQE